MCYVLVSNLKELPAIYHINLDINDLMRCIEKLFGLTANYAKGLGSKFQQWQWIVKVKYHHSAYLYPITRACGGSWQDLCVEGAPAVLMNLLLYHLQLTYWRMNATGAKSEAIYWQTKSSSCCRACLKLLQCFE